MGGIFTPPHEPAMAATPQAGVAQPLRTLDSSFCNWCSGTNQLVSDDPPFVRGSSHCNSLGLLAIGRRHASQVAISDCRVCVSWRVFPFAAP